MIGLAERAGSRISFGEFTRFGWRVTALTLFVSSLWVAGFVYAGGEWTRTAALGAFGGAVVLRLLARRGAVGRGQRAL